MTELEYAQGFSHTTVSTILGASGAAASDALAEALVALPASARALRFDLRPIVVLLAVSAADGSAAPMLRLVLVKFVTHAPVGELVAGYAALSSAIPQVKSSEWGPIANDGPRAHGFEFIFITTFETAEDRDTYLAHDARVAFAIKLYSYVEIFAVVDFVAE